MALELEYMIDVDYRTWIPVPLRFPWNDFESAEAWAADLATSLLENTAAPIEVRTQLANTALAFARTSGPLPGAIERFWHLPAMGGPEGLVHLYVAELPEATGASAEATDSTLRELATAGIGGFLQRYEPLADTAFERAARAVVIDQLPEDSMLFTERLMGCAHGMVFIVEIIEDDANALGLMEEPLELLFRSIRLRDASAASN